MNIKPNGQTINQSFGTSYLVMLFSTLTALSFLILSSSSALADNSTVSTASITIDESCTMSGTTNTAHAADLVNGTYSGTNYPTGIGQTTLKVFCNDSNGFAIYAIGYTNDEYGNNTLHWSGASSTSDTTNAINTGIYSSGANTSSWSMKLAAIAGTYAATIDDGVSANNNSTDNFTNWHIVPTEYKRVAYRTSGTDLNTNNNGTGSSITTTYDAYVSATQPAGTYVGQVKYILVHPNDNPIPDETMLDTGQVVSAKMKTLAAGGVSKAYNEKNSDIKAIRMADSLPSGFVASEANTVSTATSRHPIYIFFDNTNDAGIMYFYTGGYQVVMNPDSAYIFRSNLALSDISGLATWDSSKVTTLYTAFTDSVVSLTNLDALANWDTSSVENMKGLFALNASTWNDGYVSSLSDISGLMSWDTSNVTSMVSMFQNVARLTSFHGLEFWDTGNVTSMGGMFAMSAGKSRIGDPIIDLTPLSGWDVSNVTNMSMLFQNNNIASFLPLSSWDVGKVQDFSNMFNQTNKSTTTTFAGLENWDVSSATNMSTMFFDSVSLTDASAINGWDISNVVVDTSGDENTIAGFNCMFGNSPIHPTFTLRAGTWNNSGTFIPSS